jgi:hypothetical protein
LAQVLRPGAFSIDATPGQSAQEVQIHGTVSGLLSGYQLGNAVALVNASVPGFADIFTVPLTLTPLPTGGYSFVGPTVAIPEGASPTFYFMATYSDTQGDSGLALLLSQGGSSDTFDATFPPLSETQLESDVVAQSGSLGGGGLSAPGTGSLGGGGLSYVSPPTSSDMLALANDYGIQFASSGSTDGLWGYSDGRQIGQVQMKLVPVSVPEPSSLSLFVTALVVIGHLQWDSGRSSRVLRSRAILSGHESAKASPEGLTVVRRHWGR